MLLVYIAVIAILVGWMRGGSIQNFSSYFIHGLWLPIAAFTVEAAFPLFSRFLPMDRFLGVFVLIEYALLTVFLFFNRTLPSMWLLSAGTAVNFLVISLNGWRMPVSDAIYQMPELEILVEKIETGYLMEYVIQGENTRLIWLGDVIHFSWIPQMSFASIGDFFMAAGVFWLILSGMGKRKAGKRKPL